HSHVKLTNADMPVLLAGALRAPAAGRVSLEAELQGQGLSPASLVGSVTGAGTVRAENIEVSGLDPTAIGVAIKALESDPTPPTHPHVRETARQHGPGSGKIEDSACDAPDPHCRRSRTVA